MLLFDLGYAWRSFSDLGPCSTVHERTTNRQLTAGERLKDESRSEIPRRMLILGREASEGALCPFHHGRLGIMGKGSPKKNIPEKCFQKLLLQRCDRPQPLELPTTPPTSLFPMTSSWESSWILSF